MPEIHKMLRPLIKYPEGYEDQSDGSDASDYEPVVGEKNY